MSSVIVTNLTTFKLALTYLISEMVSEEEAALDVDEDVLMTTDETTEGNCIYLFINITYIR